MKKKIISIIVFILIVILLLFLISPIFVPKWISGEDNYITQIVRGFYAEKKNSLDVLFMGNSDMYRGMAPIELWDNYGIASYSYTSPGQRAWTGKYVLNDALKYQNPKIIVFNIDGIQSTNQSTESCYRKSFDNMKLNYNKIKAIMDPVYKNSAANKLSYIFPIFRYHSRLTNLTNDDFKYAYGYNVFDNKGQDTIVEIKAYNGEKSYMENKGEKYEIPQKTKKYIDDIIQICKNKKIELILVEVPSADSWSLAKSNAVAEYAKENDLTFIDFNLLLDEIEFDWTKDTPDGGDHLNIYGAKKVSEYMGKYLKEKFDLPDRRKDDNYSSWFESSKKYHNNIKELINEYEKKS